MQPDPLADVVRSLKLTGGVFLEAEFTAPWAVVSKVSEEDCRPFMPMPRQLIAYHVVTEGEMLVTRGASEHVARAGEILFLPCNATIEMSSERGLEPAFGDDLVLPAQGDGLATMRFGGDGARTRILCGFIASQTGPTALLNTLPDLLIIRIEAVATLRWLEASIAMAARELAIGRISAAAVMNQLSELLLVEALRAYLETGEHPDGWLAGMADPRIAAALARIHNALSDPPGIEDLAREAGMSRSAFTDKFSSLLGMGPGRYTLTQRIAAAETLLSETTLSAAEIGYRVGYEAPEAFSRAFKRETGLAPADWRIAQRRKAAEPPD